MTGVDLKKYTSPLEIIDYFEVQNLSKRKEFQLNSLEKELMIVNARVKFIEEFIMVQSDVISQRKIFGTMEKRNIWRLRMVRLSD